MSQVSKYLITMVVVASLAGCASTTPAFRPPAGSKIQVTQELSAPGGARVSIQYGRVTPRQKITRMDPHCQFYLYRSSEQMRDPVVVQTGTFTVTRTYQRQAYDGLQLAAMEFAGDPTRYPTTVMELSSDQQPEVKDLRCAIWGSSYAEGYLTINQMQATLGDLVKLIVVPE